MFPPTLLVSYPKKFRESHTNCEAYGSFWKSTITDIMPPRCVHYVKPFSSVDCLRIVWLEVTEVKDKRVKSGSEINDIFKSFSIKLEFVMYLSDFLGK